MLFMGQKPSSNAPRHGINFYETYVIYCDCTLRTADGSAFPIHRVFLAQHEYFHALFSFEAKNNNNTTNILMKGIESQTLRQILQYIYEGTLQLNKENALDIMIAADYLLLDDLLEQCRDFAIRRMTPNNCLTLLTAALRCQRFNILRECLRYVKVHFEEIVKTFPEEIGHLDIEVLKELLNDNTLNVTSEDTVRMAIDNWMIKDPFNRNRHLPDLVNYIRSEEIDHASMMAEDSTVISNPQAARTIMEPSCHINKETRLPKYLHVGCHISETSTMIYLTCDEEKDFWRKIGNVRGFPDIIGPIGKYIYFFYPTENIAQRYDMLEDQLHTVVGSSVMSVHRESYYIVEVLGMIYALGSYLPGEDFGVRYIADGMESIERYDPFTETWNLMEWDRLIEISGAVAMNGKIYLLGVNYNETNHDPRMVTLVYDPTTNVWTTVASPRVRRTSCSAVAFENRLYLIGGCWFENVLRKVEEYDPALDVWSSLPDLPLLYDGKHAKVLDGTIMVFEKNNPAIPLVRWDGGRRTWQKVESVMSIYSYGIVNDASVVRELVTRIRCSTVAWERNFTYKIDNNRIINFLL